MSHADGKPQYSDGYGKCIYCDAEGSLTDEHMLPFSLGGQHILKKASCKACASQTSLIERRVARDMWGDARTSYAAPSRRKSKRADYIEMDGIKVPSAQYPGQFCFPHMPRPGLLQTPPSGADHSPLWNIKFYGDTNRLKRIEKKYPGRVKFKFRYRPTEFSQMLLKAAYCHALTEIPIDLFSNNFRDAIFDAGFNHSRLVGFSERQLGRQELGYFFQTELIGNREEILVAPEVQIFSNVGTPTYQVVVGKVSGAKNISSLLEGYAVGRASRAVFFGQS